MGYDIPYWVETAEGDLLELPVSWRNDDWPQFGFVSVPPVGNGINPPSIGLEVFTAEFEGLFARGGLFNMTMHPFLAGRPSGMIVLERLIRHLRGFPRVWWAKVERNCRPLLSGRCCAHAAARHHRDTGSQVD